MNSSALELLDRLGPNHHAVGVIKAAVEGDLVAKQILGDLLQEEGYMQGAMRVGEKWLIQTVTLYFVGEVTEVGFGYVKFKNASWVHWTGRLSTLMECLSFEHEHYRNGESRPRTEYLGNWTLFSQSFVAGDTRDFILPTKSIQ